MRTSLLSIVCLALSHAVVAQNIALYAGFAPPSYHVENEGAISGQLRKLIGAQLMVGRSDRFSASFSVEKEFMAYDYAEGPSLPSTGSIRRNRIDLIGSGYFTIMNRTNGYLSLLGGAILHLPGTAEVKNTSTSSIWTKAKYEEKNGLSITTGMRYTHTVYAHLHVFGELDIYWPLIQDHYAVALHYPSPTDIHVIDDGITPYAKFGLSYALSTTSP